MTIEEPEIKGRRDKMYEPYDSERIGPLGEDAGEKKLNCPHCETDINLHETKRCLDAWVAEYVMKLKSVDWRKRASMATTDWVRCSEEEAEGLYHWTWALVSEGDQGEWILWGVPRFSEYIEAAMRLVTKTIDPSEDEFELLFSDGWIATFRIAGVGVFESMDPFSAPLAICRSALKAEAK